MEPIPLIRETPEDTGPVTWVCRICRKESKEVPPELPPKKVSGFVDDPIRGMICRFCFKSGKRAE